MNYLVVLLNAIIDYFEIYNIFNSSATFFSI